MAERFVIPIVMTAEDTDNNGEIIPQIAEILSPGIKEYIKMSYGLTALGLQIKIQV
jgi:hypothetical protein